MQQPIFTFPDEALEPLAERLPPLDVVRLARVSRAWREQLGRAVLTERVSIQDEVEEWSRASAVAWLSKNLHRTRDLSIAADLLADSLPTASAANGLERLELEDASVLPRLLPRLLPTCTALRELTLEYSDVTELPPLDALTRLTRLGLSYCGLIEHLPPLSSCTALKELCFIDNSQLASLPSLAGCASLEVLQIFEHEAFLYDSLELPADLQTLTELTSLVLHGCRADTLPKLDGFPRLRELDIAYCDVNASQLLGLTALTNLSELRVTGCCRMVDSDEDGDSFHFLAGAQLPPLTALPALRSLQLEDYRRDAGRERFPNLAGLTRLTRLKVSRCSGIEPAQLLAPLPSLTALVEISINDGPYGFQQLPSLSSCMQLQCLSIYNRGELTELPPDLGRCTLLKELTCWGCTKLEQLPSLESLGQLQHLNVSCCQNLQALPNLRGCTRLEKLLCSYCPKLQELPDLGACMALKEVSLFSSASLLKAPGLQQWQAELENRGVTVTKYGYRTT